MLVRRLSPRGRLTILTACLSAAPALAWANHAGPHARGGPGQPLPWRDPAAPVTPLAVPAGAHLTYFGGRVVSNMQVVLVIWGTGSYLPQVSSTASPSVATFYQGVLNSPYVDWLTEYNTDLGGGTSQISETRPHTTQSSSPT